MKNTLKDYLPGFVLFLAALAIGLYVYQDYGIGWDEPLQRLPGVYSYDYLIAGKQDLFTNPTDYHGAGFELPLVMVERWLRLEDMRDVYRMRHLVTHLFFLVGVFSFYILCFRLFRSRVLAAMGFCMLLLAPRLYAHSFFNSKDIPFLTAFIIVATLWQYAFEKNKIFPFLLLGMAAGYATGIRILGILWPAFTGAALVIDFVCGYRNKTLRWQPVAKASVFLVGYCAMLYSAWPYLWRDPLRHFADGFSAMLHYNAWGGAVLFRGKLIPGAEIPWTYFPVWFSISNPLLWLVAGILGIGWLCVAFFRRPLLFLTNTPERNFVLATLCFFAPVLAVIVFHSVIYDDWRHLYFVYPSFVLLALYAINKALQSRFKPVFVALFFVQLGITAYQMVKLHPFQQVYFNVLADKSAEALHKKYDLEYWGCGFKQALEYLLAKYPGEIEVTGNADPLPNNIMGLLPADRKRIKAVPITQARFFITNYRMHPQEYPYTTLEYGIKAEGSTIIGIYKLR